jgi:hypothetical protein
VPTNICKENNINKCGKMEKCNTLKVVSSEMDLPEVVMIREALIFLQKSVHPSRESSLNIIIGRNYWQFGTLYCQQRTQF